MKPSQLILALGLLSSCAVQSYQYQSRLVSPAPNDSLQFSNDTLNVALKLQKDRIRVAIDNRLNEGIKINWEDVSFSVDGKTYTQSFRSNTGYTVSFPSNALYRNDYYYQAPSQPVGPTAIPPRSQFTFYLARDMVTTDSALNWRSSVLFPETAYKNSSLDTAARNMQGKHIIVNLPVYIADKIHPFAYDILIDTVLSKRYVFESPEY